MKEADAAAEGASGKLPPAAKQAYAKARESFSAATKADPHLAQAWNGVGYSSRKLGDYKAALAAYDKAIELRMGYPEATEYRGEAYLALNRTEDAKQAYLDLFAVNRELAGKLLESMKKWTASRGKNKDDVEDLNDFIKERTQIAAQTAALTREATTQGWNLEGCLSQRESLRGAPGQPGSSVLMNGTLRSEMTRPAPSAAFATSVSRLYCWQRIGTDAIGAMPA